MKCIPGCWCMAEYLSLFPAITNVPETTTEKVLPNIQWKNRESRKVGEKLVDNDGTLIDRVATLEKEQIYQMEYLMNVTQILEDYKRSDVDFQKKYNDKITHVANKLDISELSNVLNNELKIIRHEFEKLHNLYAELKSCCNANKEVIANVDTEEHVEKILSGYFPPGTSKEDLAKNIQRILASRGGADRAVLSNNADDTSVSISEEHVRKIVKEILRIYDADKTGQVDYALESAGGQIISTRCTQRYDIKSRAFSLFGFTLYYESNNPRTVIQGNALQPGACWAFQDFPGYLLIQLRCVIYVTGFTLEHVSSLILPNENMSSAPKKFDVWGLTDENDPEPMRFGDYEFTYSEDNLQYFPVQNTEIKRPYEFIELRIHSNHGQLDYTCLYRFRVHGRPA
ncbi:Protein unc-84-like protein A [Harpegnathos saltator]|uniref:Protein unc-84-like protein A n=1 Tax=Harpegnathos saltator TaxID=610380 RepID=E2BD04_HARSA|nr:Protein unc-84-like protein A [Harpegnathos saltator]